jgi:nuclear pore complex protein Nup155
VDTAFYDRLTETIVGVAIVKPRAGVFQPYVRRLLVVVTCVEVVILGVTFSAGPAGNELLNLIPEPVFQLATDNVAVTATLGTEDGRIFQGGDDGCLYEICYKGNEGWFGKKIRRVNHSHGLFSVHRMLSILSLAEKDSIVQLVVDNSRHLLYALTSLGSVRAYQLDGADSVKLLASISEVTIIIFFNILQ